MPLMGKRVLLRALEYNDLPAIWEAYKDLDLELITSGDSPPVSDRQVYAFWEQRIDDPAPDMRYFVIEPLPGQKRAGTFAGMCNLQDVDMRNRHAELALWMASREFRGLGYGTDAIQTLLPYAFEVTHLEKVHLGVYDFNEGGMRSYERVGFRYEGRLRHQIYYEGRYWDEWPMRILRTEWDLIRQPPQEGLRPYHPADQDSAIALLRQSLPTPDNEAARAVLRQWWRQIEKDVYCFQENGQLLAVVSVAADGKQRSALDIVASSEADKNRIAKMVRDAAFPGGA
ncbi:MAG TPA: GNAT family protein [Aggregatilineales bacterium]|nr:GNAT family protein [Aggregatilineales bacterium]